MHTILITGIGGFVGSHLADLLAQDNTTEIVGLAHPTYDASYLAHKQHTRIFCEDIMNAEAVRTLLREINPDKIYHLAGMAHVHESWVARKETIETNFLGTFYLLEACRALPRFPRVLLVGSGECYGPVPEPEQPIVESKPLVPSS
ncbi:MAG TPA: GDP-mannose 4,6-dehydratase, partial [Acidobacteriota bacterium]|nr:GDP-mannose 4,6-dehydratase [Acidobacteriota bacterium]